MATSVQTIATSTRSRAWVAQFLKQELAPYPGRFGLVARMVLAATIIMVIAMTFQLSYAFQGSIFALLVSRESARSTLKSAFALFLFTGLGAFYLLVSAWFFISYPTMHFLWVIASFFLAFYVISALNDYGAAVTFAVMIAIGVPLLQTAR